MVSNEILCSRWYKFLVSAFLKPDSNPGLIYKLIQQEILIPLINDRIINEYLDVLSREKFHLPNEIISKIVESIKAKVISIIEGHIEIELPDEKDRVFYEVVMKSNKERESFLVIGNIKHFPLSHL